MTKQSNILKSLIEEEGLDDLPFSLNYFLASDFYHGYGGFKLCNPNFSKVLKQMCPNFQKL